MKQTNFSIFIAPFLIGTFLFYISIPITHAETVYFYHNDHLGSPLAMTDMNGNVVWKRDYKPFGEEIDPGSAMAANTHAYTGKEFDSETGLYYYGARYYDHVIGRFISVDPAGGNPNNPQTWNRYVYTLNNPYKYVDPDGRVVMLTSHAVGKSGARHLALDMVPDDQTQDWGAYKKADGTSIFKKDSQNNWYTTLSAGPEGPFLKSNTLRDTDQPGKNRVEGVVENPYGNRASDDADFIIFLLMDDRNYNDELPYDFVPLGPDIIRDSYNSNSYVSGILRSVGAQVPTVDGRYPGIDKPIPSDNFAP